MRSRRIAVIGLPSASRCRLLPAVLLPAVLLMLVVGCGDGDTDAAVAESDEPLVSSLPIEGQVSSSPAEGQVSPVPTEGDGEAEGDIEAVARVEAVAEAAGAGLVLARLDDETAVIWSDGRSVEVKVSARTGLWSDGRFVYRSTGDQDSFGAAVHRPDGTVVCQVEGLIHHLTERADGTFVAAVEGDVPDDWDGAGEYAIPMDAVDCRTGERQAIEPVTIYGGDGEVRYVDRQADRVFTGYGDAEGNADVDNERGISINGDDYAGYHTFNADASVVMYGDMTVSGPHLSPVVVARDTNTGEQLWRAEFDIPFRTLWFIGERPAIGFVDDEPARIEFRDGIDRLVLLDPATGDQDEEIVVGFDLLFLG